MGGPMMELSGNGPGSYSAPQLRKDTWNDLQVRSTWLREFAREGRDLSEPRTLVEKCLGDLRVFEDYWAFPGGASVERLSGLLARGAYAELASEARSLTRQIVGDGYRLRGGVVEDGEHRDGSGSRGAGARGAGRGGGGGGSFDGVGKPYFEVLVVDSIEPEDLEELREGLRACRRESDEFVYDIVVAPTLEDAVIAVQFNWTIQAVFLRYNYSFKSANNHPALRRYLEAIARERLPVCFGLERSVELGKLIKALRPEMDLYLVTDAPLDRVAGNLGTHFRRVFYRLEQYMEQHLSILKGVRSRYETPFFDALRRYSAKPTGVFHALPIARGKSMSSGHWCRDLLEFYGSNIFMAETSATSGGLDSLLQPRGPIKRAQDLAARAFGAQRSFFVTNGTSTANKIVLQALVRPGDIVLVDRDCHKSHHYALVLAGALPVYLDSYPLAEYSMYGAVPLAEIERQLLALKDAGKLHRVRMLILTNCTFDGITYDPLRVMERVLAIKPDMIFLWDEAWFGYGRFSPTLRRRTAMDAAAALRRKYHAPGAVAGRRERGAGGGVNGGAGGGEGGDGVSGDVVGDGGAAVDADAMRVRVYATQSTHKTLTSLRQGSMIHVYDEDFEQKSSDAFHDAYMTHTSTSPNYQIVASLDAGRRQVELEGYEMVEQTIGLAMTLRQRINEHPELRQFFTVLRPSDMIPREHRASGIEFYYDSDLGWGRLDEAYCSDEFVLDPTRVTLSIGATGLDGDAFRHLLMDKYDIQINKTSRNTILLMPNIGTTRGDVAYLIDVLVQIAHDIAERLSLESSAALSRHAARVDSLTEGPPLPNFSRFHDAFRPDDSGTPEGDLRTAYFLSGDESHVERVALDAGLLSSIRSGRELVSAGFVTPYPPGFPVLVPGQVFSAEIVAYLLALDVKEIHGYEPGRGLRVLSAAALDRAARSRGCGHENGRARDAGSNAGGRARERS
ncbi:MAG: aminotransferase class I/II-fold pyridoxal phosphate-dependent enzyme [Phycisphaerales bacterium]